MNKTLKFHDYFEIAFRRKWSFIIPFVVITMMTMGYLRWTPKIYEASTLILVESPQLPTTYVQPTVTESMDIRLRTIEQQIKSRSFIEEIIKEFKLHVTPRENTSIKRKIFIFIEKIIKRVNLSPIEKIIEKFNLHGGSLKNPSFDSLIESLRARIFIQVTGTQAFSISFEDQDPLMTMNIANRLTALFIERNLREREERAEGTILFLNKELERVQKLLKQQERKVSNFRSTNLGVLPEQMEANLRTLDRLQSQLLNTKGALTTAEENKRLLQQQIVLQQIVQQQQQSTSTSQVPQVPDLSEAEAMESQNLEVLHDLLRRLRLKYTDEHPQILRLKSKIAQLERSKRLVEANAIAEEERESSAPMFAPVAEIETQIRRTDSEMARLKADEAQLQNLIKEYERRVEITPKIEQELSEITRGYEVTQREYQSLLDKKLQAELAASMEKKQKGQRFKVLDMAKIPENPVKPKSLKVILLGLLLASLAGLGLVVAKEQFDTSFYKIEDLEGFTELSVIASIPKMKIKKKWRI